MKIRLALVDQDQKYATRLLNYYGNNYSDKLELSYFTSFELFFENLATKNMDAVLVEEHCKEDLTKLREKMLVTYFSESSSIDSIEGIKVICKYQKPDLIYKEILSLYSEFEKSNVSYKFGDNTKSVVETFMPVSGGAGATSIAVAYAKRQALKGMRTLFLSFANVPCVDLFFQAEGTGTLEDVIYALKSKKSNLALKLESLIRQDLSGVYFFSDVPNILDMQELKNQEIELLLQELLGLGNYDKIVVDMSFDLGSRLQMVSKMSDHFNFVTEVSDIGIKKLQLIQNALKLLESGKQLDLKIKSSVIGNKVGTPLSAPLGDDVKLDVKVPFMAGCSPLQIIDQLTKISFERENRMF